MQRLAPPLPSITSPAFPLIVQARILLGQDRGVAFTFRTNKETLKERKYSCRVGFSSSSRAQGARREPTYPGSQGFPGVPKRGKRFPRAGLLKGEIRYDRRFINPLQGEAPIDGESSELEARVSAPRLPNYLVY